MILTLKSCLRAIPSSILLFFLFFIANGWAIDLSKEEREFLRSKDDTIVFVSQTRYPPFEFINDHRQQEGMMLDVVRWIAVEAGFQPVFVDMPFKQAQGAVLTGKADVITSLFYSAKREDKFAFTRTLYDVPGSIFVDAERTDIKNITDLNGKIIAIQRGDHAKDFLESQNIRFDKVDTQDFAEAIETVRAGKADAVIGDEQIVLYYIFSNRLADRIKKVGEPLYIGKNCMAAEKSKAMLIGILDKGIQEAKKTGVLDKISQKWLGTKFGQQQSFFEHYLWPISAAGGGLLLLAVGVWAWNVRLRTLVRQRTAEIILREQALRESEKNFRTFFETIDDMIFISRPDGGIFYANPAVFSKLGYIQDELENMHILEMHPLEKRQEAEAVFEARSKGELVVCPLPLQSKTGAVVPVETRIWFGQWNGLDCIFWLSKDLAKEQEALQKFNQLFINNPALMAVSMLRNGRFTDINKAFLDTLGFSREEILGKTAEELNLFVNQAQHQEAVKQLLERGSLVDCELQVRCNNGTILDGLFFGEIIENHGQKYLLTVMVDQTKRKQLEQALRDSEEKFRILFNNEIYAICIFDLETNRLLDINDAFTHLYGYGREELLAGMNVHDITEEHQASDAATNRSLNQGTIFIPLRYHRKKDGTVFPVEIVGGPYVWKDRKVMFGLIHDITDRKFTEDQLDTIMREQQIILDNANIGISMVVDRKQIWVNRKTMNMFSYSKEELEGQLTRHLFPSDEAYEQLGRDAYPALAQGRTYVSEQKLLQRDGTPLWIRLNGKAIEPANMSRGTIWLLEDISESKHALKKLQESEERYRTIFNASPVPMALNDEQQRITFLNRAFIQTFGYTLEDIPTIAHWWSQAYPNLAYRKEVVEAWQANFDAAKRTGAAFAPLEVIVRCKDLSDKRVVIAATSISDTFEGNHLVVLYDVTELKRAVEEAKSLQSQLLQSQKMEAIGTLAGGIAHDFNNILGAIIGYAEIAKDDTPLESYAIKNLDKVLEASHRAATLVKQILAFSRQEKVERTPLQPARIIKEVLKLLRPSLPSTIEIRQQFDATTKAILADPTQLHQILINLCTNSFHAMEQSGGILEITLNNYELSQEDIQKHPEVNAGSFVMLSISDTGSGIDPDIWGRIFDPYFTTKEVGKGTGMGLSIVHGIVTNYGGFIICENNIGGGTVFRVFFPALEQEVVPEVEPVEEVLSGTERILFVDDEEMLADLGKVMLEHLGYDVTSQTSSLEALATFQNQPNRFDAVITDQTMSGMTGMELARKILQIRPNIPIVLCTGYSSVINEEQAKAEGIKGFADKPVTKKVIAKILRKVLDESRKES